MTRYSRQLRVVMLSLLLVAAAGRAADWYVDNATGSDDNPGTAEKPFLTIARGMTALRGGDTLHLAAHDEPYREMVDLNRQQWAGTPEKPTVIDGHGAVISGLRELPLAAWESVGNGVYSRPLKNNAWVMDRQGHWSGFPLVFFDGRPAEAAQALDQMGDFSYFLLKIPAQAGQPRDPLHNTLYIKLPIDMTPDTVKVMAPAGGTNFHIGVSNVVVRGLTSAYAGGDGFSTTRAKGLVFEDIRGCFNMDQGISNHGAEAVVRHSRFDQNAGCGIVDVYPECRTRYVDCVVVSDVFRGGVEFYSGEFEMEHCLIQGNPKSAVGAFRDAKVRLVNCVMADGEAATGFTGRSGSGSLEVTNCTFYGLNTAVALNSDLTLRHCAFLNCETLYKWRMPAPGVRLDLRFTQNFHTPAAIMAAGKNYTEAQWRDYVQATGLDIDSVEGSYEGGTYPVSPIVIEGIRYGAKLDPAALPGPPAKEYGPY